jgi:predicted site-specific integrase-resolvase
MAETARWLTPAAAADRLGVYPHQLSKLVKDGKIRPPSRTLGAKSPRYDIQDLDNAMSGEGAKAVSHDALYAAVATELATKTQRAPRGRASKGRRD